MPSIVEQGGISPFIRFHLIDYRTRRRNGVALCHKRKAKIDVVDPYWWLLPGFDLLPDIHEPLHYLPGTRKLEASILQETGNLKIG